MTAEEAVTYAMANASLAGVELDDKWQAKLHAVASGALSAEALIKEVVTWGAVAQQVRAVDS